MPGPKKPVERKEMTMKVVRRGFAPGISEVKVRAVRTAATKEARLVQIEKFHKGMQKINFATAPPKRLLNIALFCLSFEELTSVKFGPKKQPVLYEGPLVNGLPTGLNQGLIDIVGRYNKRKSQGKPELLTDGEIRYLRKNLPNVTERLRYFLQAQGR